MGFAGGKGRGAEGGGGFWGLEWASFSAASIAVCTRPAVDSQLLHQNNKRRPHKGRSWAGRWQQTLPPVLLHWAHFSTVATETEPFVSLASFPSSFHHSVISSTCSPVSLPRPSSILLLSPASLEQISSCLSLARSKYTSYNTSHCSATAVIYLAADSEELNPHVSTNNPKKKSANHIITSFLR